MGARANIENDMTITLEWLEKQVKNHFEPYLVIEGFYSSWDRIKDEKSPNLETILNFMYQKGYKLVSIQPMGNPNCKEMVFMQS
jgi:cobalamin biosynthesis Co2+ chelatase CbiK